MAAGSVDFSLPGMGEQRTIPAFAEHEVGLILGKNLWERRDKFPVQGNLLGRDSAQLPAGTKLHFPWDYRRCNSRRNKLEFPWNAFAIHGFSGDM